MEARELKRKIELAFGGVNLAFQALSMAVDAARDTPHAMAVRASLMSARSAVGMAQLEMLETDAMAHSLVVRSAAAVPQPDGDGG